MTSMLNLAAPHLRPGLPGLSFRAQAIVDAIRLGRGTIGPTKEVARLLGLPNRFALGRMLLHEGLPGLRELAGWISILGWLAAAEQSNAPLLTLAVRSRRSPAACYRLVRRLTGLTWLGLKARGSHWALVAFVKRCKAIYRKANRLSWRRTDARAPRRQVTRLREPRTMAVALARAANQLALRTPRRTMHDEHPRTPIT